jgi:hypothetical protein
MSRRSLRGSTFPEAEFYLDEPDLSRSLQYNTDGSVCQELDVVAACEGTSNQRTYTGIFRPINATECDGSFEEGFPIYKHAGRSLYLYPIGYYSDSYSVKGYRGLVRWRLASFHHVDDKSCRRTQANIYQVDFAADGQPYNYYPTFACFDENGSATSGYQESRILIICKDNVVTAPEDPEAIVIVEKKTDTGLIIGIIVVLLLLLGFGYWYKRRSKRNDSGVPDMEKKDPSQVENKDEEEKLIKFSRVLTEDNPSNDSLSDLDVDLDLDKAPKPRSSRGLAQDPPASPPKRKRSMSRSRSLRDAEGYVPQTIRNMVDNIEKMFDKEDDNDKPENQSGFIEPKRTRSISNPFSKTAAPKRSNSLEPDTANVYADRGRSRSRSVERSSASDFADGSGRSRSTERSKARDFAGKVRDSSLEQAKNFADFVGKVRRNSLERSQSSRFSEKPIKYATPVIPTAEPSSGNKGFDRKPPARSLSLEGSKANEFAVSKPSSGNKGFDRIPPARSLSLEGSKANEFAVNKMPRDSIRGRSRSMERSKANNLAEKPKSANSGYQAEAKTDERKDKSRRRSRGKSRDGRSLSLDRSKANSFAKKQRPPSIERSKANDFSEKKKAKKSATNEKSNLGTTVKKQSDGSVIVAVRRQREDGAIVCTKTKYASAAAAKKRGIDV